MFNSVVLNVFIGIAFIYLLYSLYTTIIMELINSFLGLRARNLAYTLKRMLKDEKDLKKSDVWNYLRRFWNTILSFLGNSNLLKKSDFYTDFINQPAIKYLSSGGIIKRPSYMHAKNFSKALLDVLKADLTKEERKNPVVAIEKKIIEYFKVENEGNTEPSISSETGKYILNLLHDANDDVEKFKIHLEEWYDTTMERSKGWFRKKTQTILLIVGFILAVAFNVDTIQIINKLSKDENAQEQIVQLATAYVEENQDIIDNLNALKITDSIGVHDSVLLLKIDELLTIKKDLDKDVAATNTLLSLGWPDTLEYDRKSIVKYYLSFKNAKENQTVYFPQNVDQELFKEFIFSRCKEKDFKHMNYFWFAFGKGIWGYVLTALAISLGAPFWFDLLNKLVKLRSSTKQAEPIKLPNNK